MSTVALTHTITIAVPLLLLLILMALIYRRKGVHPETYKLGEEWTHEPILWASEEPVDHGRDSRPLTVGGGASGKW